MNWTEEDYNEANSSKRDTDGGVHTYGWTWYTLGNVGYVDAKRFFEAFANRHSLYTVGQKVLIVGCGIGASVYHMRTAYDRQAIWGVDISTWIHTRKMVNAPINFNSNWIANIDILGENSVSQVMALVGDKVDWLVCESVTETISNRVEWYAACEALLAREGQVLHLVQPEKPLEPPLTIPPLWERHGWTWQSMDVWAAEKPSHYWVDISKMKFRIP